MTKPFKTLDEMGDIQGKRVLVREDLNVPMAEGRVTDDTRLRATVATVGELADKGAIVLVLAHFGRPKGKPSPEFSLSQVVKPYSEVLGREVRYIDWEGAEDSVATLEPGDIISTGTPPGVGFAKKPPLFLKPGDECVVRIEGLGELRNRCVAEE